MKKSRKKVMIITLLIIAILLVVVIIFQKINEEPDAFNDFEQNVATQVIVLPDGHHVLAEADFDIEHNAIQGWIGAKLTDLTTTIRSNLHFMEQAGVYIQDTYLDSPAQIAGILPGDILIKINNVDANDVLPTINLIASLEPGHAYPFTVFRQGKYFDYSVTITKKTQYF